MHECATLRAYQHVWCIFHNSKYVTIFGSVRFFCVCKRGKRWQCLFATFIYMLYVCLYIAIVCIRLFGVGMYRVCLVLLRVFFFLCSLSLNVNASNYFIFRFVLLSFCWLPVYSTIRLSIRPTNSLFLFLAIFFSSLKFATVNRLFCSCFTLLYIHLHFK